ncbi:MAG: tRNA-dihydrouridine synthase [Succinivibrionaceae bacterium]
MNKEIVLAPMEGVLDYPLREVVTSHNKYDYCVSEFIRVHDIVYPKKVYYREVPELKNNGGFTKSGTPVWVQLLGAQSEIIAANAKVACDCGALGIDINFGCPSRFVHRTNGGAAMLRYPKKIAEILQKTRDTIPSNIPLSAKIRLGWEDIAESIEIFENVIKSGVKKVIVHARTKKDGYIADKIQWKAVAPLKEMVRDKNIDIIINGEIKDRESAKQSQELSGCDSIMLARYALSIPNLERVIRDNDKPYTFEQVLEFIKEFIATIEVILPEYYQKARVKQLMGYIRLIYPELRPLFIQICQKETMLEIKNILN